MANPLHSPPSSSRAFTSRLTQPSRTTAPPANRDVLLGIFAAVLLLSAAGAGEYLTAGLNDPIALRAASDRLSKIPESIGEWTSTAGTITERELQMAQAAGFLRRTYQNQQTGYSVTLTVLCGPAGPMSVHQPTACFEGVGYELASGPHDVTIPSTPHDATLSKAAFRPPAAIANEIVRVFWSWNAAGIWQAPTNPRLAFRGQPLLYKLYVVDQGLEAAADLAQAESFLTDALPVIQEALRP